MDVRLVTEKEAEEMAFMKGLYGQYGLWDKEKKQLFLTTHSLEICEDTLDIMTPAHPRYPHLEIVQYIEGRIVLQ